ncbi:hypothetical protein BMS3Bbin11_01160 [bacterium BMS3Bbin11]|nr:hypothetical protein BMS3Bbin11_01160 [bacterium BMS3Bbin11]
MITKTLKEFVHQIRFKFTDAGTREIHPKLDLRATGKVDDYAAKGFIQWHKGITIAGHTAFVTQCLLKGLAKYNTDIFNKVMCINM